MRNLEKLTINFQDEQNLEVTSFSIRDTYAGSMEGTYHTNLCFIVEKLMEQTKEKGFYFQLTADQLCEVNQPTHFKDFMIERIEKAYPLLTPPKALKRYRYELSVGSQQLERLKIVWFGDAPTLDQSLSDIITPHIANTSFHTHAYKVNLDDF